MSQEYLAYINQEKIVEQLEKGIFCPKCHNTTKDNFVFYPLFMKEKLIGWRCKLCYTRFFVDELGNCKIL